MVFLPCRDADGNNPKPGHDPIASDFSLSACFSTVKALFALSPEVFMGLTPHGKSPSNPEEGVCVHTCVCTCVQEEEGKSQREVTSLLAGVPPCWDHAANQDRQMLREMLRHNRDLPRYHMEQAQ